jgi:hypothetical protein
MAEFGGKLGAGGTDAAELDVGVAELDGEPGAY